MAKYKLTDEYKKILTRDAQKLLVFLYKAIQEYAASHKDDADVVAMFDHMDLDNLEVHLRVNGETAACDSFANVELDYAPGALPAGSSFNLMLEFMFFIPLVPNTSCALSTHSRFIVDLRHRFDQFKIDNRDNVYSVRNHDHLTLGVDETLYKPVYPQADKHDWDVIDVPVCAVVAADCFEEVV